jgi:hypothetical protein
VVVLDVELDSGARVRIDPRSLSPTPGILRASRLGWADSTLFPDGYRRSQRRGSAPASP